MSARAQLVFLVACVAQTALGCLSEPPAVDEPTTTNAGGKADTLAFCDACQGGCAATGCPDGFECVVGDDCIPSACSCDEVELSCLCTADCNGGSCEPIEEPPTCEETGGHCARGCAPGFERPTDAACGDDLICCERVRRDFCDSCQGGCASTGCPDGFECVVGDDCIPSACNCDEEARSCLCTADCNGGRCEPIEEPPTCEETGGHCARGCAPGFERPTGATCPPEAICCEPVI
jgi:hypothetical protein